MTSITDDIERVTDADVRAAERAAREAAAEAEALENAIASGDRSVALDDVENAERKSRFAKLFAQGQQARRDRYVAAMRIRSMEALRKEVHETAPGAGDAMTAALKAVEAAAREFTRLVEEHDAIVSDWLRRIDGFRIAHGTTERGITKFGTPRVDGVPIELVSAPAALANVFGVADNSVSVRPEGDAAIESVYRMLDAIGEVR